MSGQAASQLQGAIRAALDNPTNGRIITIMGPNGAGKSKLLRQVKNQLAHDCTASYLLPPVRNADLHLLQTSGIHPKLNAETSREAQSGVIQFLASPPQPDRTIELIRQPVTIAAALRALLVSSSQSRDNAISTYKDKLYEHDRGRAEKPVHPLESPSCIINSISELLGYKCELIKCDHTPGQFESQLQFHKDGSHFGLDGLSDGERQLLLVSIFLMHKMDKKFVFLADEPELYLNEARAIAIWERIEEQFPAAIFVYATHNVNFATRPTASVTYILNLSNECEMVDRTMPLPRSIVCDIVGARIQLARTGSPAIFCEDTLSKVFLSDLFHGEGVEIVSAGNYRGVEDAVSGERGWKNLRSDGNKYCGIIDMDMRDNDDVVNLENKGVFCLPVNEVESVLLIPEIALKTLSRSAGREISLEDYTDALVTCAENNLRNSLYLLSRHLERSHSPTIRYTVGEHGVVVNDVSTPGTLIDKFVKRGAEVYKAIKDRDVITILRLFKGKDIYKGLCGWSKKVKIHLPPNPEQRYNDVRDMFTDDLKTVDIFKCLRKKVLSKLAL